MTVRAAQAMHSIIPQMSVLQVVEVDTDLFP